MSGKLDQSLDEIMKDNKTAIGGKRGRAGRLPNRKAAIKSKAATTAVIAPAGGVQKKTKPVKQVKTVVPTGPATGESKVSVSNLPEDVDEKMIKEYFAKAVGPVKRVIVNYGPNGRARGSATIIFSGPTTAAAAVKLDGTKVDGRPMRIEMLMGAKNIAPPPPPKSLQDRVTGPKNAARENAKKKAKQDAPKAVATNGTANGGRNGKKKAGRMSRPKKTAEELDAEMQDYFVGGEAPATNGTVPAAAANGGDTGMTDEVL